MDAKLKKPKKNPNIRMGIDMEHYYEITVTNNIIPPTPAPDAKPVKKRSPAEIIDRRHFLDMTIWLTNCLTLAQQVETVDTKALVALLEQARSAIPKDDV